MATLEKSVSICHFLTGSIGLLGNGLLFYLSVFKTPRNIRTYSILIMNFATTDFLACLTAIFVQQRLIPAGMSLAYISNGPCKILGITPCYIGYSAMLHFYSHSLWSLFLSFLYRYYVLKHNSPTSRTIVTVLLLFYSLSFFQFITFCFAADPPNQIVKIIKKNFPNYNLNGEMVNGTVSILKWNILFCILHMTIPSTPIYIVIIIVRKSIIKHLHGHNMSDVTKSIHKQLLKALTFQAALPSIYVFAVGTYVVGQSGLYRSPLLEYSTFVIGGLLPCISPFGYLYFVRPYKAWICKNVFRKRMEAESILAATSASRV